MRILQRLALKVDIPSFRTLGFGGIVGFSSPLSRRLNVDLSKRIFFAWFAKISEFLQHRRNFPGATNGRMLPNTPEMSQMIFSILFEACLVNLELP